MAHIVALDPKHYIEILVENNHGREFGRQFLEFRTKLGIVTIRGISRYTLKS